MTEPDLAERGRPSSWNQRVHRVMTAPSVPPATGAPAVLGRAAIVGIETVLGVGALSGGIGLVTGSIRLSDSWLEGTPFGSWVVPGVALLLVIALPMLSAAVLETRGAPSAPTVSVVVGVLQVGWIAVQLLLMQRYHVLQPLVLVLAAGILLVAGLRSSTRGDHSGVAR